MQTLKLGKALAAAALLAVGLGQTLLASAEVTTITEQDAYEIGVEAYTYLYPLVLMDMTRRHNINFAPGQRQGLGPMNLFHHMRTYQTVEDRDVVRPNFDTLYSRAWIDLTKGPVIVGAPDTGGRYYLLPMIDMWTDVFAVPGKRTSGTGAAHWALALPDWQGALPEGVERIDAPTPYVWIIGRTKTDGPKDYERVHEVQAGYKITPLSQWGKAPGPVQASIDPTFDMKTDPVAQVHRMPAARFFAYGSELMKLHPPHPTDWSQIARLRRIGLEPGKSFDLAKAVPAVRAALERVPADAIERMQAKLPSLSRVTNGWLMNTDTMGVYGDFYLKRAIVALAGLGANQPEDAIYPLLLADADGQPPRGGSRYVLHFDQAELPPVDAFWSVTMYDADGFQIANPLNRFAIGDRDPLAYNSDGSLDLYIQHESPGGGKEANWLPAPASGPLGITMRLYAPKAQALDGRWNPPALRRID